MSKRNATNSMQKDVSMVKFPVQAGGKVCFGGRAHTVDVTSGQSLTRPARKPRY